MYLLDKHGQCGLFFFTKRETKETHLLSFYMGLTQHNWGM